MNKSELITSFAQQENISFEEANQIITIFFDSIEEYLTQGKRVELRGFGSFKVKQYDGYTGRNPRTGEQVQVQPKKLPCFKMGKELKELLNS